MTHGQTISHEARFVVHVISFIVQDLLHIPLFVALDTAVSINNALAWALGVSALIAALAPMVVWLCHDEDTYWVRPSGFRWLYARIACVVLIAALSGAIYLNPAVPISTSALAAALFLLCAFTLIDACVLTINGLRA